MSIPSPRVGDATDAVGASLSTPAPKWPAVSTQSQVSYRPQPDFLTRFRISAEHGHLRDSETEYREQVYRLWNITGTKKPSVFRP